MGPVRAVLALLLVLTVVGCSSKDDPAPGVSDDGGVDVGTPIGGCGAPETHCPCTEIGKEVTCTVMRISDGYVSCSTGTRTCLPTGKWGACEGAAVIWDGAVPSDTGADADAGADVGSGG
jgi:hypothetical protein